MNIKKLFPEKKLSKKGLLEFLDKKGFYIVLILCIAIVAVTAVFVTTHNATSPTKDYDAQKIIPEETGNSPVAVNQEKPAVQSSINTTPAADPKASAAKPGDQGKPVAQASAAQPKVQQKDVKSTASAAPSKAPAAKSNTTTGKQLVMPVTGQVSFEYAEDKLVYSKTLEEWRTHSGVDLAADRGTVVKAAADGIVSEIKSDPRFGITIIVDHQNGLKTVYSNLASDDMVTPNQRIKQGDVIGSVGNSAAFESAEQPHLHFEVLKDNVTMNPMDLLPKQ